MPTTIRVIGSLNVDFTTRTPRFPKSGETLTATSLYISAGGKGANQAVACGRATTTRRHVSIAPTPESFKHESSRIEHVSAPHVRVEMIGAVGANDVHFKELLRPALEGANVVCSRVMELEGAQTGTATIIVDEGANGENRILVVPGANHSAMRCDDEIELSLIAFHEKMPDVIVLQGEIPKETVFGIIDKAKEAGLEKEVTVIFNPAPVYEDGIPEEVLAKLDVLIMNESELLMVASKACRLSDTPQDQAERFEKSWLDHVSRGLHDFGVKTIIVTLGARGVYYSTKDGSNNTIPGVEVKQVLDTTAAGDTFVGHFTAALAHWKETIRLTTTGKPFDIEDAVNKANKAAALCVQRNGAMGSIPWGYEI